MMQNITFDPAMMQRTRTKYSITHAAKRALALAVAAAILTTGAFALGVSLLQHIRNQMGSFGSQVMPIAATCQTEDEGFEFSVVASMGDGYVTHVYVQVKDTIGGRLNENSYMHYIMMDTTGHTGEKIPEWKFSGSLSGAPIISFDEQTQTALFEIGKANWDDQLPEVNQPRTFQIIIDGFYDKYIHKGDIQDADNKYSVQLTGVADRVLEMDGDLPVPGQTPMEIEGLEGIKLSSAGFDSKGVFHSMFELSEGVYMLEKNRYYYNGGYITSSPNIPRVNDDEPAALISGGQLICSEDGRFQDSRADSLSRKNIPDVVTLNIAAAYRTRPWEHVDVILEPTIQPSPAYVINQPVDIGNDIIIDHAQLSTLGFYVDYTPNEQDTRPEPVVITMKDGTTYTYTQNDITGGMGYGNGSLHKILDYWGFFETEEDDTWKKSHPITQPLDITQVDKVTINGVEIPFDR